MSEQIKTIWRSIKLLLSSRDLPKAAWELLVPNALHSMLSLLCTSTEQTPHERFLSFPRRSTLGTSMPNWLLNSDTALLRKFVRSKSDPLCENVQLIDVNPKYALIEHPDGRQSTVSTSDLAPCPQDDSEEPHKKNSDLEEISLECSGSKHDASSRQHDPPNPDSDSANETNTNGTPIQLRRSTRVRHPPVRYGDPVA